MLTPEQLASCARRAGSRTTTAPRDRRRRRLWHHRRKRRRRSTTSIRRPTEEAPRSQYDQCRRSLPILKDEASQLQSIRRRCVLRRRDPAYTQRQDPTGQTRQNERIPTKRHRRPPLHQRHDRAAEEDLGNQRHGYTRRRGCAATTRHRASASP